jgi:hypothetical protein
MNTKLLDILLDPLFKDYPIVLLAIGIFLIFIWAHFSEKINSDSGILFWGFFGYFVAGGFFVLGFFGTIIYLIKKIF